MKNVYPLLIACLLLELSPLHTIAQPICGFDHVHAKKMREDINYQKQVISTENSIRTWIKQHPAPVTRPGGNKIVTGGNAPHTLSTITIPVVVHVIHTGGDVGTIYNPSDAQILRAINYLNSVYNGTYPGTQGAGDLGIQFALAQRDPNCNPTNGINRVDGSGVAGYVSGGINVDNFSGADEVSVKDLSRWDNTQYYNIWIVNRIDGNDGTSGQYIAGFAYFPGIGAAKDGIVMLATQMETGQKTLPHEIGHAFSLYHPFQGSADVAVCPSNTDCNLQGDQVCDTPPISENINPMTGVIDFSCRSDLSAPNNVNPCTGALFTPATEYNYMNYTTCYNQFTVGQAQRMQASLATGRASLAASSGAVAPSGASCSTPKIDFELQGDRHTEATALNTGCRNYKDYSYNVLIGGGSTATATATLTVTGGTAVQGLDFDMTTNGSFASPSLQLTFPAGSSASQPFTIRVYDDAGVNGTRTATLGFTVNNGGGNVIAGDGRPNFILTIADNDYSPTAGTATTGTKTIGAFQYIAAFAPFDASQQSQRAQILYKASELTAAGIPAGPIRAVGFQINSKNSIRPFTNLNIKMGMVPINYLYDGSNLTIGGGSMTQVKSLASYSTVAGANMFNLDAPFIWDGSSSIIVELCYDNGTASPSDHADQLVFYTDGGGSSDANALFQNSVTCEQPISSPILDAFNGIKPVAYFTYGLLPTTVQTALSASQSQYLGPNADVYFYDQANGQLLARIQNLSAFDYGCTQVTLDRAGTGTTQFWNANTSNYLMDKTFHVVPTTNNPSGSYNITLYYTQAEVQGWQTATAQTLSAIQLVKVPGQIFSVTPSTPNAAGTPTIVTPTIGSLGTNTGLTYNFTNGFSGFGAGVPSIVALPITLLDFTGRLEDENAVLSWSTSSEQNSSGFEVRRSLDGQHFSAIGYVPAAGNSDTRKDYAFTDRPLTADSNYYQLKEISLDGTATYSRIVLVRYPHSTPDFTVLPNPFSSDPDLVFGHVPAGPVQLRLLDITGRQLWKRSVVQSDGARLRLDLGATDLAPGVYLLEVRSSTGVGIQRIIKR